MQNFTDATEMKKYLFILCFLCAIGLFLFFSFSIFRYTVDDAYITYRYADHLVQGKGLVFNFGHRVEGYSNLSWVLILALGRIVGWNPVLFSKLLGLGSGLLILGILCRQEWLFFREEKSIPIATILAGWSAPLTAWAVGGLETVFYALLISGGFICIVREQWKSGSVLLGLAAVTRPEGILFAGWAAVLALMNPKDRKHVWVFVVLFFPWALQLVFRLFYYGQWLPNTFDAKVGVGPVSWWKGLDYLSRFFLWSGGFSLLWLLLPYGVFCFWKKDRKTAIVFLTAIGLQCFFILFAGGDWMKPFRFMVPVLPFLYLFLSLGFNRALLFLRRKNRLWAGCFLLVTGFLLVGMTSRNMASSARYANIYATGLERTSISMGRWLAERAEPTDWIALGDVGALPYYSGLQVIDLYGLVNPEIARLPGPALDAEGIDVQSILERKPRFIALEYRVNYSGKPMEGLKPIDRKMSLEPAFQKEYVLIQSALFSPSELTVLFERRTDEKKSEAVPLETISLSENS